MAFDRFRILIGCAVDDNAVLPRSAFFNLRFTALELLGDDGLTKADYILRREEDLSWQLHVPENCDAMIWIGANQSGNRFS